jgi:hypothetical protein
MGKSKKIKALYFDFEKLEARAKILQNFGSFLGDLKTSKFLSEIK